MKGTTIFMAALLLMAAVVWAAEVQPTAAVIEKVTPAEAKTGDVVAITGAGLGEANIRAIYLTNGKSDFKMEVTEQNDTLIRFRVTKDAPSGNLRLVFQDAKDGTMLEEPAFVKVTALPSVG